MLILPMETPAHMEMAQREILEQRTKDPAEEITEEKFLKDLYLFMKKRDTPIERIPNLGFKQIDLFLMFKIVRAMGGYHQVMAQQLWKQVYNSLGGNPRSTSAATCTRRHYEKLLLPYECHLTGILVNVVPRNQPKHFHFTSFSREDSPRPAKRRLTSVPLHQNPPTLHSHPRESVFPLSPRYPPYYHPGHAVLPPYVPISSPVLTLHSSPPPKPCPFGPLDKATRRETYSTPTSSFSTPSSSKTPKFLNKPSPLYTPRSLQVMINDGSETQDGEASLGDTSYPEKAREAYVNQKALTASGSPTAPTLRTDEGVSTMAQRSSSPKTEVTIRPKEERVGSPEVREPDFTDLLPGLPRENGGKIEIEVPLSVFHNWLKLCGSSVRMHGPPQEEHSEQRKCPDTEGVPTNIASNMNHEQSNSSGEAEDLTLTRRNFPSPNQSTGNHHKTSQDHFTNYNLQHSDILKRAASQDVFGQREINKSSRSRPTHCWDAFDKETQAATLPVNIDSSPRTVQRDYATSISCNEDTFTTEEVMKLKKIISRSL
ncbi:AT-rich interactive domain containing protein 5B [Dissostichus eleginoides]|uniref:AT-rich interactive domain containing protein 5B n=1 Tax=Dissostichus eleginoides TaxID=100907 RepID=A0AAD9BHJ7_DISEL|nr:AT-rich interactive domain containing protein 5B [Dissostichus eleginoides]